MKKPPDKKPNFLSHKVSLKTILHNYDILQPIFKQDVLRGNQFALQTYEFMKLHYLFCVDNGINLGRISKEYLAALDYLMGWKKDNRGKVPREVTPELRAFYTQHIEPIHPDKIYRSNFVYTLDIIREEIVRCLETNIKTHFIKYIKKYVNVFMKQEKELLKRTLKNTKERAKQYKVIHAEYKKVKDDIIECKITNSNVKFHSWILEIWKNFFPFQINVNIAYDVQVDPQKYLYSAVLINREIERLGDKPYQVFPQRTSLIPSFVTMESASMITTIGSSINNYFGMDYTTMLKNLKKVQKDAWDKVLCIDHNLFEGYVFNNRIQIDGDYIVLNYIRKEYYGKTYGTKLPEFEEVEIPKLTDLSLSDCNYLKQFHLATIDPGKNSIVTITDTEKFYEVSSKRRRVETYSKRSSKIIEHEKKKNNIDDIELYMSKTSGRSCHFSRFKEYVERRSYFLPHLQQFYHQKFLRSLRFRRFIRTKSFEDRMLDEIHKKFGDNTIIGLGNWSVNQTKQIRGCAPSPNKGIHRLLKRKFFVFEVDEYLTSQRYNKNTSRKLINYKVKRKYKKGRKSCHQLLTPEENPNGVIVNRDRNAALNIHLIVRTYFEHQIRPADFHR